MKVLQRLRDDPARLPGILATVNTVIWIIALIAMIILMQDAPEVKKLAPILMAGLATGVALVSAVSRARG